MVFLLVSWSRKQSEIEESSLESMAKQWKAQKHEEPKLWSFKVLCHKQIFWSTSWSSIYAYYMSFRSSGSYQFNASNGTQFGVEMKELQPLEADHTKLKANFAGLRNHKRRVAKSSFGCEMVSFMLRNSAALLHDYEILLKLPDICDRYFEIFCFRYLMSKFPNSPCNPPIIRFLSL